MLEVENLDVSWFAFFCFPEQIWMLALWRIWISHWKFLSLYTYTCILWKKIHLLIKSSGMSITMENKFEMIKWMMRYWCTSKILQQLIHSFVIFKFKFSVIANLICLLRYDIFSMSFTYFFQYYLIRQ